MGTNVVTKKQFIETLEKSIKDDEVILWTNDIDGQVTNNKRGVKLPFMFAPDAGISLYDLLSGLSTSCSFIITTPDRLSERVQELLKNEKESGDKAAGADGND